MKRKRVPKMIIGFSVFVAILLGPKYPKDYNTGHKDNSLEKMFKNPEVAFEFVKRMTTEKKTNHVYNKIKISLGKQKKIDNKIHTIDTDRMKSNSLIRKNYESGFVFGHHAKIAEYGGLVVGVAAGSCFFSHCFDTSLVLFCGESLDGAAVGLRWPHYTGGSQPLATL